MTAWEIAVMSGNVEIFYLLLQLAKHKIQPVDDEYCKRAVRPHKYGDTKFPQLVEQFKVQRFRYVECEKHQDLILINIANNGKPIAMSSNCTITGNVSI